MNYIVEDGKFKDDFFGKLTICKVPDSLLREFMRKVVWLKYPGGISEALQDLMRKEVQKQKKLDVF
jgi:thymidylate kinase